MLPSQYALLLYRGDSYQWVFRFWLDAGKTQPADLTGQTVRATVHLRGKTACDIPCVVTLPNEVTMTISGQTWTGLVADSGSWDLQLIDAAGWLKTPLAGSVFIHADVTVGV